MRVVFEDLFFFDHRFIFSLARVLCVVFFFGSDHNFGISFCPPFNVRGKCGTRGMCSRRRIRVERGGEILKVLSSSALFRCFFFRKKRFLFQRERELFSVL